MDSKRRNDPTSILHFFEDKKFEKIGQFYSRISSAPTNSAQIERLFSSAKDMIIPKRSSLKPETIRNLLAMKHIDGFNSFYTENSK